MKLAVCAVLACFVLLAEARSHHNPNVQKFLRAVKARKALKEAPAPPPVINAAAQICGLQTAQFVIDAITNGSDEELAAFQATALGIADTLSGYLETFEAADLPDDMEDSVCPELPDMTELAELRAAVLTAVAENSDIPFEALIKINIAKQIVGASVLINSVGDIDCSTVEPPPFLAELGDMERGLQDLADNIDCPTDFMICAAANAQDIEPEQFRQYLCVQALLKLASTIPNIVAQLTDNVLPANPIQLAIASNVLSADEKRMRMAATMTRDMEPQQLIAGSVCAAQTGMFVIRNILEADDDQIAAFTATAEGIASQLSAFFESFSNADIPDDAEAQICPELAAIAEFDDLREHVAAALADNGIGIEELQAIIKVKIAHQIVGASVLINAAADVDCEAVTDPTEGDFCPTDGMLCMAAAASQAEPEQFRQFLCVQAFLEMVTSIAGNAIEQLPANPIQLAVISHLADEAESEYESVEARNAGVETGPGGSGALCQAQTTQFVIGAIQDAMAASEGGDATVIDAIKAIVTGIASEVTSYMEDWDPESLPDLDVSVCPDTMDLPEFSEVVPAILSALVDMGADEERLANIFKRSIANNVIGAAVLSHVAENIDCPTAIVEERLAKVMPMIRPGPIDAPVCPEPAFICLARHAYETNPEALKNFLCAKSLIEIAQSLPLPITMQLPDNPFEGAFLEA